MDKFTAEQINSAFANLSTATSQAMFEIGMDARISEIAKKFGLDDIKSKDINFYITLVVIGLLNHNDFANTINSELQLSKDLLLEVEQKIFEAITEQTQKIKESEDFLSQNDPAKTETPSKIAELNDIPLPPYIPETDMVPLPPPVPTTSVFKKPENPIISNVETKPYDGAKDPAKEAKQDSNMFAQKLITPTMTNKVVSDQTIPPTPTENKTATPNPVPSSAKDPYREVLE